jgi:hypothetical protein
MPPAEFGGLLSSTRPDGPRNQPLDGTFGARKVTPMRTPTCLTALTIACLGGCGAPRTPELDYVPPSGEPASDRSAFVQQRPWLVWGNIVDHLQQQGHRLADLDEQAGRFVILYSGDPEPYVDCGWIVTYEKEDLERLPAARSDASFRRRRDGRVVTLERDLRLEARVEVQVEGSGEDAVVRTDGTYVLTKTIGNDAGQPLHTQTVRFRTGESATFSSGTTCQPTGELERLVFDALPRVSFAGS